MLEPTYKYVDQGLFIACSIIDMNKSKVTLSVMNVNNCSTVLKFDSVLGSLSQISEIYSNKNYCSVNCLQTEKTKEFPQHLKTVLESCSSNLNEEVKNLLMTFSDVFVGPDGKLGQTNMAEHFINTGNAENSV
jgi:hypothetical protein